MSENSRIKGLRQRVWIGVTGWLGSISLVWSTAALAATPLSPDQLQSLASDVTVKILTPGSPGSGVLIGEASNRYWVLTAAHVLESVAEGEGVEIQTEDAQFHNAAFSNLVILSEPNFADLALVSFRSTQDYPTAALSTYAYRLYEDRLYTPSTATGSTASVRSEASERGKHVVFVSGWPLGSEDLVVNPGILEDTTASVVSNPETRYRNYELVYTNLTYPGMSGGPIFNTLGHVIGIHGRADGRGLSDDDEIVQQFLAEAESVDKFKIGHSLGISTQTFLQLAADAEITPSWVVLNDPPPLLGYVDLEQSWRPPLKADSSNPFYWLDRGNQLWRIGQVEEAQADFDQALQLRSDFYLAWFAKGYVYGFSQQYEEALSACNRAVEISEAKSYTYYEPWRCRGEALRYLGQLPTALEAINKAIGIQSQLGEAQNPTDLATKAEILFGMQQYQGALEALDRATQIRSNLGLSVSPRLLNSRGVVLAAQGRYLEALAEFETALQFDPEYATAWDHRGLVLKRLGRTEEALEAYQTATDLDPENVTTWNNLGSLLYELARYEAALEAFDTALQIDPTFEPALANRETLLQQIQP